MQNYIFFEIVPNFLIVFLRYRFLEVKEQNQYLQSIADVDIQAVLNCLSSGNRRESSYDCLWDVPQSESNR